MKQDVLLQTLKQKNAELTTKFGVKSLSLFGSVARNEATAASDVDLLVEVNRLREVLLGNEAQNLSGAVASRLWWAIRTGDQESDPDPVFWCGDK